MMLPTTSDIISNRSWLSHFAHILSYSNDLLHLLERKLLGKMIQNITDTGHYLFIAPICVQYEHKADLLRDLYSIRVTKNGTLFLLGLRSPEFFLGYPILYNI